MAVGIFRGMYVTAESATNYIDVEGIKAGCLALKEAGELFTNVGDNLKEISSDLGPDTLSVQGATMQLPLEECGEGVSLVNTELESVADQIMVALEIALDKKQQELNEAAVLQDAAMHAEHGV